MERAYDTIGLTYAQRRRPDPRIAEQILRALGDAESVLNVGAGTGSYEPHDRRVIAVEPSEVMLEQRGPSSAPAIRGMAERLPFSDRSFDAALAILTIHHWIDRDAGLAEMRRTAARRIALVFDQPAAESMWLWADYFPEAAALDAKRAPQLKEVVSGLEATRVEEVLIPHDCADGFGGAYWRRPERYLDPAVREGISSLAVLPDGLVERGLERLRADLESRAWHERHGELLGLDEIDLGYRLVIAD
jgi:SAM-dependent methyltransferase